MKYEEINANETICKNNNIKVIQSYKKSYKKYKIVFSITFAMLLFANVISITCIISSKFKTNLIKTFSSFNINKIISGEDNLFNGSSQFKYTQEFSLPIKADYNIVDNALVFTITKQSIVSSACYGIVSFISCDSIKEICITKDEYTFHYLNLSSTDLRQSQVINEGQEIGNMKADSKLYFFVSKNNNRLDVKIQNDKVVISE